MRLAGARIQESVCINTEDQRRKKLYAFMAKSGVSPGNPRVAVGARAQLNLTAVSASQTGSEEDKNTGTEFLDELPQRYESVKFLAVRGPEFSVVGLSSLAKTYPWPP